MCLRLPRVVAGGWSFVQTALPFSPGARRGDRGNFMGEFDDRLIQDGAPVRNRVQLVPRSPITMVYGKYNNIVNGC